MFLLRLLGESLRICRCATSIVGTVIGNMATDPTTVSRSVEWCFVIGSSGERSAQIVCKR